jgi:hypothetical protein
MHIFRQSYYVTGRGGLQGCQVLRISHCIHNRLTHGGKVVSLTRRLRPTPHKQFLIFISVSGWVNPNAILGLEGLGKPEKKSSLDLKTRDILACSIVKEEGKENFFFKDTSAKISQKTVFFDPKHKFFCLQRFQQQCFLNKCKR